MPTSHAYIVYGPQGSGKSVHAHRLMYALKCTRLVDEYRSEFHGALEPGALGLVTTLDDSWQLRTYGARKIHIDDALALLNCDIVAART